MFPDTHCKESRLGYDDVFLQAMWQLEDKFRTLHRDTRRPNHDTPKPHRTDTTPACWVLISLVTHSTSNPAL